jgi:RND family efflux transporter MFP subunit
MRILLTILLGILSAPSWAIDLNGITEFDQRLTLNSSISGRVERIHVEVGERVTKGDLLLSLVSTGLQARVDIAGAEVDALAPDVERMSTELEKAQELFDRDSLAMIALQQAEQDHAIAEAKLAAAQARLTLAQFHLSQSEIRSPINGIVLGITTFPGQYINTRVSNQTLLSVADSSSMSVQALLPVELYSKTLLNRSAEVVYLKKSYVGRVVAIDRQVRMGDNNHPAMYVQIKFQADGSLPAGLPVKISVEDE